VFTKNETLSDSARQHDLEEALQHSRRANVFLSEILRNMPLAVVVVSADLHVELWNNEATDLWGVRPDEARSRDFFGLDIGLPVEQLRQPILSALASPDEKTTVEIDAINWRGRAIRVRVLLAGVGGASDHFRGLILLMQEIP
jgi:two-component system CheB/CheR fusion protein